MEIENTFQTHVNNKLMAGIVVDSKTGVYLQYSIPGGNKEPVLHQLLGGRVAGHHGAGVPSRPAGGRSDGTLLSTDLEAVSS